ncbi:sugar transferase [Pleurocapsa sp. PCC 7319]|uniref:sugar transferase n=1 Tax=Pleurocapsa sp. PCC 7319 TaxID=118161 RepID=UPI00034931D8|nr:sugar transferase [Pleurocapsa sp. PCC 7319]
MYRPAYFLTNKKKIYAVSNKARDLRLPQNIGFDVRNITRLVVLTTSDLVAIALGWHLATNDNRLTLLFSSEWQGSEIDLLFSSFLFLSIFLLSAFQAYGRGDKSRNPINSLKAITLAYLALIPIVWELYGTNHFSQLFWAWLLTLLLSNSFRLAIFKVLLHLRQRYSPLKVKVMLIGEREDLKKCIPLLKNSKEYQIGIQLDLSKFDDYDKVVTMIDKLNLKQIDEILICSGHQIKESKAFLWKIRSCGVYWRILELETQINRNDLEISQFEGITALSISELPIVGIDFLSKRIFDITFSFILLVVLSLPIMAIALLIKLDSPGAVFYKQTRVGLKGNYFKVWKFRTMVQNANQLQQQLESKNEINGGVLFKIKDDPRITRVGKYLRKYSLDELPQLFNVLRGEMSLVGPRPLPLRDVEKFAPEHYFRHEVLPGITGLWQVSGRSDTDSENLFNLDFEYIQNWSLALDFEILLRTIGVVLNSKGAY